MKVGDVFTLTRENHGSAGYTTGVIRLKNLALIGFTRESPTAKVQFAPYRPWLLPDVDFEQELVFHVDGKAEAAEPLTAADGGTAFRNVDADSKDAFQKAFGGSVGAAYTPFLVATQTVAGTNYIFAVNGKGVYPGAAEFPALVRIHKGTDGKARVAGIKALGYPGVVGAYISFRPVAEAETAILKAATAHWAGGGFEVSYVSTQVVAGVNYRFAGTETLTDGKGTKVPVLVTVYAPLDGTPRITAVQNVFALV